MDFHKVHASPVREMQERMLDFVRFLLADFGAVSIVKLLVSNTVLDRKPFNCSLCMGFWIGLLMTFNVVDGLAGAASSWALYRLITNEY